MDSLQSLMDQNRGPSVVALLIVLTVISTIIVMLRIYSRLFVRRGLGWDDGMMLVAVIFSIAFAAANFVHVKYGYGRHRHFLNEYQSSQGTKWGFIAGIFYNLAIFFVKFSIILFLLRIEKLKTWVRTVIYLDLFLVFGSLATAVIVQLVQCIPITHNWDPDISARCLPPRTLTLVSYISSAFTAMTDFVCAILPFFILWNSRISKKAKTSIWTLLCFGMLSVTPVQTALASFFSHPRDPFNFEVLIDSDLIHASPGVCSVVKICYLSSLDGEDYNWSSIPLTKWGAAEIHSGIVAASIPAIRPLVLCITTRLRGDPKPPRSSYESRNPYRHRARNQDGDDSGTSILPLHERSDAGNQYGVVKTTEFEVTSTTKSRAELRSENPSEGGAGFVNSSPEGSI
ncbi:hypothetical protein MMC22_002004 [Lobaria immixta]|nr:hypothetical protein [Lobaria immixta]